MPTAHKISVVDDDESVRQATRRLIRSLGYDVEVFALAQEFLQSPRLFESACLILDVQMGGMDGLQLQRHLKAAGYQIPIIFITAYPDEDARGRALKAGAIDFLHKPFSEQALLNSLTSALKSRQECDNQSQCTAKPERIDMAVYRPESPTETEALSRSVATNQALISFETSALLSEGTRNEQGNVVKRHRSSVDIEDRKRGKRQLRALIDAIPQQIWSGPPDGTLDYCNDRWRSYMGLEMEDIRGDGWQTMLHPDDRDRVLKAWHESVVNGTPYEQEERHRGADGTYRWFLARGVPLRDAEGRIIRWYGTNTDIEDRKQAEEELRRLSGRLLRSQDEERRRIARDLHDSTGQDIVALTTMLDQLRGSIPSTERKSRRLLSECKALADRCIREVRTLSYVLHPPVLDEVGLLDAIRDYVTGFTQRSGIQVALELSPSVGRMPPDIELALFRVVQESLTNIQRHSGSQQAKIRIDRNSHLTLEISDHGRGASASAPRGKEEPRFKVGVGISSMQERVKLIGGRLEIASTSHGTTVRVTIPPGNARGRISCSSR